MVKVLFIFLKEETQKDEPNILNFGSDKQLLRKKWDSKISY
jgi:hypothetical protein